VAHCQAEARRIIRGLHDSDEIIYSLSRALLDATSKHGQRESPQTTLDIQGKEIPISPAAVHHLVCIGQEAVPKAIRHAGSSRIAMELRSESDLLHLIVRDNGRNFHASDHSACTGHFGIPVMEEGARKLGGALRLMSSVINSAEFAVTVSFNEIRQAGLQQQHVMPWIGIQMYLSD
jgi:signal transduction histidine kinase